MSAKFFGITECSFCKPVATPSLSLSLATSLSFASLCLTVHFARVFRAALPSTTSPSSLPSHSVLLTPHCKNCNSILCDLLLPHCLPLSLTLFLCFSLFLPVLPSHMIMRYSSLRGSSPNCQRHRHRAPLWTPQKPLKLRAA